MGKMRNFRLLVLFSVAVVLSGCDVFRSLAGRPTSAQIEAKRQSIEAAESFKSAILSARADSLKIAREAAADSLSALASLQGVTMLETTAVGGVSFPLQRRYYIVVGSFKSVDNARRFASSIESRGYEASLIPFKSGLNAVGLCGADKISSVSASFKKLRGEDFCPSGAWILINN